MEKLQWFKFTPTDWIMGRIQRCPEVTQARFMRLCCLYWNKECKMLIEDAEIEIDIEHLDILISKKIILTDNFYINISFLDEQLFEIEDNVKDKRTSGLIGNLKRWHIDIYNKFMNKEITLEQAIDMSKTIAPLSHPDGTPIAPPSQNIADKIREEEIREEKIKEEEEKEINRAIALESDFEIFWNAYDKKVDYKKTKAKFISLSGVKRQQALNTVLFYVKKTEEKKYRKNPLTWLNGECWKDELAVMKIEDVQEPKRNYTFAELMERDAVTKTNL
jgi:hypothetical protein